MPDDVKPEEGKEPEQKAVEPEVKPDPAPAPAPEPEPDPEPDFLSALVTPPTQPQMTPAPQYPPAQPAPQPTQPQQPVHPAPSQPATLDWMNSPTEAGQRVEAELKAMKDLLAQETARREQLMQMQMMQVEHSKRIAAQNADAAARAAYSKVREHPAYTSNPRIRQAVKDLIQGAAQASMSDLGMASAMRDSDTFSRNVLSLACSQAGIDPFAAGRPVQMTGAEAINPSASSDAAPAAPAVDPTVMAAARTAGLDEQQIQNAMKGLSKEDLAALETGDWL